MRIKRLLAAGMASMLLLGTLAGCGGSDKSSGGQSESADGTVTLKWVTIGNGMPDNYDSWIEKVNAYTSEKIGVNIEM